MSRLDRLTKSSNPVMGDKVYEKSTQEGAVQTMERMTVQGAINKSFLLMGVLLCTGAVGWMFPNPIMMWGGAIGGLVIVLLAVWKTHWSPILAPIYAALEGLFVGSISAIYASAFDGIVFHAVSLTMAVLFLMLFIYKTGIIKVTSKFRTGVIMATGAVMLVYVLSFVLGFFGINLPFLHEGGMIGIGISLVIIGIASLNLLLDFDNFDKGEQMGAPKYMEWFSAMGLMITLVWLYIEILRLLAMLSSSD